MIGSIAFQAVPIRIANVQRKASDRIIISSVPGAAKASAGTVPRPLAYRRWVISNI